MSERPEPAAPVDDAQTDIDAIDHTLIDPPPIPAPARDEARGRVVFVGAGPGAPDLVSVRGARAIENADIIIWASSLVHPDMVANHKPGAELIDSASIPLEDLLLRGGAPGIQFFTQNRSAATRQILDMLVAGRR